MFRTTLISVSCKPVLSAIIIIIIMLAWWRAATTQFSSLLPIISYILQSDRTTKPLICVITLLDIDWYQNSFADTLSSEFDRSNTKHHKHFAISSLTHSLDRLTGDGSLRRPDVAITSHVPSSICSEPDIDLQLADPGLSGTTPRTFPLRFVIRSVTGTGVDNQTKCFMRGYWSLQTTYYYLIWARH